MSDTIRIIEGFAKDCRVRLLLFTRPDCDLCDQVALLATSLGATVEHRDITEDIELLRAYGTRIPVLKDPESGRELDYPIDVAALKRLLDG